MPNHLRQHLVEKIRLMTCSGSTIRQIIKETGCSPNTVHRHQIAMGLKKIKCPCGDYITHRGWCTHRYLQSKARQQTIAILHGQALVVEPENSDDAYGE